MEQYIFAGVGAGLLIFWGWMIVRKWVIGLLPKRKESPQKLEEREKLLGPRSVAAEERAKARE